MKRPLVLAVALLAIGGGGYALYARRGEDVAEIEYRYEKVAKGDVASSISATGLLVPLTTVEVKSRAGGELVRLAVDEGARVKRGQLLAVINPNDTRALYEQANADLTSADARAQQAGENLAIQRRTSESDVRDAQVALGLANTRLARAKIEAGRAPKVSDAALRSAQADYESSVAAYNRLVNVTIPQQRRAVEIALQQTRTTTQTAQATVTRNTELLSKGYISQQQFDTAQAALATQRAASETAQQTNRTLEADLAAQRETARLQRESAAAALRSARANLAQGPLAVNAVDEARRNVRAAEVALRRAQENRAQVAVRASDEVAAKAAIVRSRVAADNAKFQLDQTNIVAPRDGVIVAKIVEEGTILPPALSSFATGTSIFQLADTTQLFVECGVDEADISDVKAGQRVKIGAEAFPGQSVDGVVDRVNPAAKTDQNITSIKVRVRVKPGYKLDLLPGMNATCEFITQEKRGVLTVPAQAIQNEGGKAYVRVKTADPKKPERREVKLGVEGNEGFEVTSGLKEGEEVVTAEIDLAQLRETEKKMKEVQEGGGLTAGSPGGNTRRTGATTTGARGGGGGRSR